MFKKLNKTKILRKTVSILCAVAIMLSSVPEDIYITEAATIDFYDENSSVMLDKGGFKKDVYGVVTDDWGQTWKDRNETLPPATTYLTDNYRETVGTVPTNDWASSVVFDKYSESLYAHPLAYRAASNGMQMASPAVVDSTSYVDGEATVESLLEDNTVELVVGAESFKAKDAKVDKAGDWSYEILMENESGNGSMRATIAKGTPYAYYVFDNLAPTISLGAGATNLAIYKNSSSSNTLGVSLTNKKDGKIHYYMVNAPKGTTWTNAGGKLTANMPAGKRYLSIAILPDNSDAAFSLYQKYAFNFITDTKVEWEYLENASKVVTKYNVITTNMETNEKGGDTIIALYPHQWRYAEETYTGYIYNTIRGTMKTIVGSSYITQMTYNGMLSTLPVTDDETTVGQIMDQLGYLYYYRKTKDDPKWICYLEGQYGGYDTYWVGKNLNTLADAIWLADQFKDEDMQVIKDEMVAGVENYLQFWFDPFSAYISGRFVDDYFYYKEDYGTLIGYPTSYGSDKEMNDHHFHYGYWIKAASAIAMNDPQWAEEWGGMVYEMISDIANANRDGSSYNENSSCKYPFLRNFDIYEGHSWASGVANYEFDENGKMIDEKGGLSGGNNQESSSEAVNAWASIAFWGEVMGDTRIRDLGIYMYTTEIAAIEDYYYDVHNEIFTDKYEDKDNHNLQTVTRLFGGRYDHTAWWTESPIEVTTITMLPISGATLYLGKHKEKVKNVVDSICEDSKQWKDYVANKDQICKNYGKTDMLTDSETNQDVIAEFYAYYDADKALEMFDISDTGKVENGESRAHTLAYISSLKKYGAQNFDITSSNPFALVLEKDGVKTYVAENYTETDKRVYFSDGTYVDVPANSSYEGPKTGDGENPEIDDSELLGTAKKINLETYLENQDGTGYELTSRTMNVKSDSETYTYQPKEIAGFTYDATNPQNHLTVSVGENILETVKVYYKRNNYTVQYVLNGGQNSVNNPTSYRYGSEIALKDATKEDYIFDGWYADAQYTSKIAAITSSTYGNLTLHAKFVKESDITSYKVEYYKQNESKTEYSIVAEDTQIISSIVGNQVTAEEKKYDGYVLNANSVTTGVVLPNGELILRLYYDSEKKNNVADWSGRGGYVDANNNLTLFVGDAGDKGNVLVYYRLCDDLASAQSAYETAVSTNGASVPGYFMTKTDGIFKQDAGKVSDTQYVVYRFNINQELTEWKMISIADLKQQSAAKKEQYTVRYYKQNKERTGYDEVTADAQTLEGNVEESVLATQKSYIGFSVNTEKSQLSGVVKENGGLELKVYYDRNTYLIEYRNLGNAVNNNPSDYVYGTEIKLNDAVRNGDRFIGWYTDTNYTEKIETIDSDKHQNFTLYAKFESDATTPETTSKITETETTPKITDVETTPGVTDAETTSEETGIETTLGQETTTPVEVKPSGQNTTTSSKNSADKTSKVSAKRPAKAKISKAKIYKKKRLLIKVKKVTGARLYKIQISTKKNFKKKATITRFSKKTQYVIRNIKNKKKLKKAKKYCYIRVKACRIINGRRLYSKKWSRIRKVKMR